MTQHKLPNLVIAGVVKGGTTSLFSYLSMHPKICSSSVKETCFFSRYRYGQWDRRYHEIRDPFQHYCNYFRHCTEEDAYILEATPGYFEGGAKVSQAIQETLGTDVKVLIILRDPVERLLSFFKYKKSMLEISDSLTLSEYIRLCHELPIAEKSRQENDKYWGIEGGYYARYITDWFDSFGENLKIVFFDTLSEDPGLLLECVCQWLELDATVYKDVSFKVENKSVGYKSVVMQQFALAVNMQMEPFWRSHPGLKAKLRDFYYALNGNSYREGIDSATHDYLQSIYATSNKELRQQLEGRGYDENLPRWLVEA